MVQARMHGLEDRIDRVESVLVRLSEAQAGTADQAASFVRQKSRMTHPPSAE